MCQTHTQYRTYLSTDFPLAKVVRAGAFWNDGDGAVVHKWTTNDKSAWRR